jgi:hypothetical protein
LLTRRRSAHTPCPLVCRSLVLSLWSVVDTSRVLRIFSALPAPAECTAPPRGVGSSAAASLGGLWSGRWLSVGVFLPDCQQSSPGLDLDLFDLSSQLTYIGGLGGRIGPRSIVNPHTHRRAQQRPQAPQRPHRCAHAPTCESLWLASKSLRPQRQRDKAVVGPTSGATQPPCVSVHRPKPPTKHGHGRPHSTALSAAQTEGGGIHGRAPPTP